MVELDEFRDLFAKDAIAHLSTVLPDGAPHVVPVWIDFDGEHILTAGSRTCRRHKNMKHDPRVAISIDDPDEQHRGVAIRGRVAEMDTDGGIDFLDKQARVYWGLDRYPSDREKDRYLVRIDPERVTDVSADVPDDAEVER